jgi:ATP-dependent Clp protease ATP-binding subunit ClpA
MFERFSEDARQAVRFAQDEARDLRHDHIGTEHLLIGMAATSGPAGQVLQGHGVSAAGLRKEIVGLDPDALASLGIDLERVREAAETALGPGVLDRRNGPRKAGHLPLTKQAKQVLGLSLREAERLKSGEIGSGHLLLGVLRDRQGKATLLLRKADVDLDVLAAEVTALIPRRAA